MTSPVFHSTVEGGELIIRDRPFFDKYLTNFKEGELLELTLKKYKKNRTLKQNAYYFGVVLPLMAEHTGYSANEIHEIEKRRHLPRKILTLFGKEYHMPGSTATLSVGEMVEYVDRCIADAAEMGINVPPPDGLSL
jgi:hypothetical protein